ncbi:hypothetical protein E2320_007483, partial [Naja naja]
KRKITLQNTSDGTSSLLRKGYFKKSSLMADHEAESSSEEQNWPVSHWKPNSGSLSGICSSKWDGSLSSQDSRTESASLSQSQTNHSFGHHINDQQELQRCSNPLLGPPKCRTFFGEFLQLHEF